MKKCRAATSHCVGCGCNDFRSCIDGCWWLEVDTQRGVGVCSQCGPKHSVKVFAMGDGTWWAGACSAAEILVAYRKENGIAEADALANEGELPQELTLLQLHKLTFSGGRRRGDRPKTFFEMLTEIVESGATFPCVFAGSGHRGNRRDNVNVRFAAAPSCAAPGAYHPDPHPLTNHLSP